MSTSDDDKPLSSLSKPVKAEDSDDDNAPLSALKVKRERDDDFVDGSHKKRKKKKKDKKKKDKSSSRKSTSSSSSSVKRKRASMSSSSVKKEAKPAKIKVLHPLKLLEQAVKSHTWWDDEELPEGQQWKTLQHNGVMFPPPYVPHNVKLLYDGQPVDLTPEQEEVATFYAAMPLDGPQLGNEKTAKVFNKNFFRDFKAVLGRGHAIKAFEKIDWTPLRKHVEKERAEKKAMSKEAKEVKKAEEDKLRMKYSFALVDGNVQKVANLMVEPPGLFRGRGDHPKTGTLKKRVIPEQITLNLGENDPVPPCPIPGHSWGRIVHKHDVTWLAYWKENVMDAHKYVWLAPSSAFKGKSDMKKYEKARKLKNMIGKIRGDYERKLVSKEDQWRQIATAMWVIDRLALRVGNEKDEDSADTVGCCSLRVEHISLEEEGHLLTLDFLGKDSMRHRQTYELEDKYGETGIKVFKNFKKFTTRKKPSDDVFDRLNPSILNDHLKTLMDGLSAKVFRTYNASWTLQSELPKQMEDASLHEKVLAYNAANRQVAILCNHQKTVSKSAIAAIEKAGDMIDKTELELEQLRAMLKRVKKGKSVKLKSNPLPLKKSPSEEEKKEWDVKERARKLEERHLFAKQPTLDQVQKRIKSWVDRLHKQEVNLKNKDDNKDVALSTSKINYMDPRITVAWTKRNEVPVEKVFATTLRDKFPWAMSVPSTFEW